MLDFAALPPEINSGRMYSGPGAGSLLAAAQAWDSVAADLQSSATEYRAAIDVVDGAWQGPSATAMTAAAQPYIAWMTSTAEQAQQSAVSAMAAANAFEAAYAATINPALIVANRTELMILIATNILGQNTPAIAANEAEYAEYWAQDATAMYTYAASSSSSVSSLQAFTPAPQTTTGATPAATTSAAGLGSLLTEFENSNLGSTILALFGVQPPSSNVLGTLLWEIGSNSTGGLLGPNSNFYNTIFSSGFFLPANVLGPFVGFILAGMRGNNNNSSSNLLPNSDGSPSYPNPYGDGGTPGLSPGIPHHIPGMPIMPGPMPHGQFGVAAPIGGLSVPQTWMNIVGNNTTPPVVNVSSGHPWQAGIPVPPAVPVTSVGRSSMDRAHRPNPEYGRVSKIFPKPHPSAG